MIKIDNKKLKELGFVFDSEDENQVVYKYCKDDNSCEIKIDKNTGEIDGSGDCPIPLDEIEKAIIKEECNCEDKVKDLQDKLLRVQADSQNYKRRLEEETKNVIKYANENLIIELLPTLDNFERAIALDDNNLNDELSKFLEGFKMIYTSFLNILNSMDLKEIEALEQPFDPVYHQAVMTDKDETKEDGIILEVLQKGYMLKDKVIRPALVKVNNL